MNSAVDIELTAGHALRIAYACLHCFKANSRIDMGLYRCLPYLVQSGMGVGKSASELESERSSVIGARCWLAVSELQNPLPPSAQLHTLQR